MWAIEHTSQQWLMKRARLPFLVASAIPHKFAFLTEPIMILATATLRVLPIT